MYNNNKFVLLLHDVQRTHKIIYRGWCVESDSDLEWNCKCTKKFVIIKS